MSDDRRDYWLTLLFVLILALRAEAEQGPAIVTPGSGGVIRLDGASVVQPGGQSDAKPADSPDRDKEKANKEKADKAEPSDKAKPD